MQLQKFYTQKKDHPFILLPIEVFIKPITLVLSGESLLKVLFQNVEQVSKGMKIFDFKTNICEPESFPAGIQLLEYFRGKRTAFTIKYKVYGTPFQKSVWNTLSEIPYGETLSYKQIADKVNNPRACRAVGSSCGANPLPIFIPCHRALASNGGLGGFSGGLDIKIALLEHEKRTL